MILSAILLAAISLQSPTNPPVAKTITPLDEKLASTAAALEKRGADFDVVFRQLCRAALAESAANPNLGLDDCVRSMFGGLWLWTRAGGSPTFQGQNDRAQHFIGGGAFEGYWDAGRSAAVRKERIDMQDRNNYFDLDDMAATMMGARWMDLATVPDQTAARRWVELWASGWYSLTHSLPKLHWGHMPPGESPSTDKIRAIRAEIDPAITLPPPPPPTPPASPPR